MPLIETKGSASAQGFGFTLGGAEPVYIEQIFSTFLYTGTGAAQTITNGIDLSTKGGLVWLKGRSAAQDNNLCDTVRGDTKYLISNSTAAQGTWGSTEKLTFLTNGFTIGADQALNTPPDTYASWTFRKQPKFFDVVTYTGNGAGSKTINHNLGSVPGCIIVKRLDSTGDWLVYHRGLYSDPAQAYNFFLKLNTTSASSSTLQPWSSAPTSTSFSIGSAQNANVNGATYVAYLFAHDAGGFGLTGTDNVISCGSFTTDGNGGATVNLGYEPQWVMWKRTDGTGDWTILDNMRGWGQTIAQRLVANTSAAEDSASGGVNYTPYPTATGFYNGRQGNLDANYIYIAIRRGPMKTPTSGTSVFSPNTQTGAGTSAGQTITTNFPVDLEISSGRVDNSGGNYVIDRLRGGQNYMRSNNTNAEVNFTTWTPLIGFANNTGITDANYGSTSVSYVAWNFRRAPGFFDEVCYTGTGSATTFSHNLGVVPELMIAKERSSTGSWWVYAAPIWGTNTGDPGYDILALEQTTQRDYNNAIFNSTQPTASVFSVGGSGFDINDSGATYVNYLFASCPGVSKVGSYTGTGGTQTISCGFAARFVLIKRADSTGNWWVWDTARGMVAGTDPRLALNSTAAETNANWVYTDASGFQIVTTDATVNASGGTYLYLAIS